MKIRVSSDWLWRGLIVVLLVGAGLWVAWRTEWVDIQVPTPLRGEAARNNLYATQQLAQRLGAVVATPTGLDSLPPPPATLLLDSWDWSMFPERARRLRAWVEGGGHLVLYASALDHEHLQGWLPIQEVSPHDTDDTDDDESAHETGTVPDGAPASRAPPAQRPAPPASSPSLQERLLRRLALPCVEVTEPDTVAPSYATGPRHFKLCTARTGDWLRSEHPAQWSLDGPEGPLLLRAAVGRGQVTVIEPEGLLGNAQVLQGDNGLIVAAALQMRAGRPLWFVTEEARQGLMAWLWQQAWVVFLLGAAALLLALWRGAVRFGPRMAVARPGRRSMAEQIAGTARFLRREGPEALLGAQIRALDQAARGHVASYDQLDRTRRAEALARLTGLEGHALGLALDTRLARRRTDLPATLALLETARRRLTQAGRHAAAPAASPSPSSSSSPLPRP